MLVLECVYRVMLGCARATSMLLGKHNGRCNITHYAAVVFSAQRQGLLCEEEENSEDDEVCIAVLFVCIAMCVCVCMYVCMYACIRYRLMADVHHFTNEQWDLFMWMHSPHTYQNIFKMLLAILRHSCQPNGLCSVYKLATVTVI